VVLRRLDRWIDKHVAALGSVLIVLVLLVYAVSQFIPDVSQWIITRGFFNVLLVALMVDLIHRVIDLKGSPSRMWTCEDQQQALPHVQEFLEKERPETCDLIEYSTISSRILLQELKKANLRIRLLMCHPDQAISDHERKTIEVGIENIRKDFRDYKRIKVKLYTTPAAFRGRNFGGKFINVGWYLYSHSEGEISITGHDTAMILSEADTREGQNLKNLFNRAFDALWNDPATVELVLTPELQRSIGQPSEVSRLKTRRSG
jgi:hypothetical protein